MSKIKSDQPSENLQSSVSYGLGLHVCQSLGIICACFLWILRTSHLNIARSDTGMNDVIRVLHACLVRRIGGSSSPFWGAVRPPPNKQKPIDGQVMFYSDKLILLVHGQMKDLTTSNSTVISTFSKLRLQIFVPKFLSKGTFCERPFYLSAQRSQRGQAKPHHKPHNTNPNPLNHLNESSVFLYHPPLSTQSSATSDLLNQSTESESVSSSVLL